jgi:protein TonB
MALVPPVVTPVAPPPAAAAPRRAQSSQPGAGAAKPAARSAAKPANSTAPVAVLVEGAPPVKSLTLKVRSQVMPQLPKLAMDLGIASGHVVVVLKVSPEGTVERVELVSASPPQVYDTAMEHAFQQWTFEPLGIPGRMTVEIEVRPPAKK